MIGGRERANTEWRTKGESQGFVINNPHYTVPNASYPPQARISLARAVYSPASILLLDDILAALDMHTALSVITNCFSGALLEGRTVILVTHFVSMISKHASPGYFVHVGSDGKLLMTDSLETAKSDVLLEDDIEPQVIQEEGTTLGIDVTEIKIDEVKTMNGKAGAKLTGKLIVAEEIALGRVTAKAGTYFAYVIFLIDH